jgi:hypothetical protein
MSLLIAKLAALLASVVTVLLATIPCASIGG